MKKILFGGLLLAMTLSCQDDDSSSNNNNQPLINEIGAMMRSGTWKITTFVDNGTDETTNFDGYNFTFSGTGVVTAANGSNSYPGAWSVTNSDDSDDDTPDSDIDFNIEFAAPPAFMDLTDDWDINERTANRISLIDVSNGDGGTDILVFERIQN